MRELWSLPRQVSLGGESYGFYTDFRDILQIIEVLQRQELPLVFRWQVALRLFYQKPVPPEQLEQAITYLAYFLNGGAEPEAGVQQMDWQQDAEAIIADVNRVAGRELRQEKQVHWWTFLSFFHSIGEGQLSFLVGIRNKLRRGEKLLSHEQEYYRLHSDKVRLQKPLTDEEKAQKQQLLQMLRGRGD